MGRESTHDAPSERGQLCPRGITLQTRLRTRLSALRVMAPIRVQSLEVFPSLMKGGCSRRGDEADPYFQPNDPPPYVVGYGLFRDLNSENSSA
jgi:hypothetical protein